MLGLKNASKNGNCNLRTTVKSLKLNGRSISTKEALWMRPNPVRVVFHEFQLVLTIFILIADNDDSEDFSDTALERSQADLRRVVKGIKQMENLALLDTLENSKLN